MGVPVLAHSRQAPPGNDACQLRRPPKFQDDQGIVTEVWLE